MPNEHVLPRFTRILCTLGSGDSHERLLERTVDLALKHQARVTVVDVVEPMPDRWLALQGEDVRSGFETTRKRRLEQAVAPHRGKVDLDTRLVTGKPYLSIIRKVLDGDYDLVIRESENPDWLKRVLGSDDMQLVRHCPCPVWLIGPSAPPRCRRVLAAVDAGHEYPSDEIETRHALNRQILDLASSVAIAESAELHVIDVWERLSASYAGIGKKLSDEYNERTERDHAGALASLLQETADAIGPEASSLLERHEHLVPGYPRRQIPELVERLDADLVVMGSIARIGVPGLFVGNTAESVLSQIRDSVLVIKPPGFVSPLSASGGL